MKFIDYFIDDFNDKNVPPINIRINFPKGQPDSKPTVTVQLENRTLSIATHAIDILLQNLEEIHTREEKSLRKQRPNKFTPIDIHLNNLQILLDVYLFILVLSFNTKQKNIFFFI